MRFLLDANLPRSLAARLEERGHEVVDIRDIAPPGIEDEEIFRIAQEQNRVIITQDLGFGDILRYPLGTHAGIVVIRLRNVRPKALVEIVSRAVEALPDDFAGSLAIVEPGRVRLRRSTDGRAIQP